MRNSQRINRNISRKENRKPMKIGIHYEPMHQISSRLYRYEQILKYNGIDVEYISSSSKNFLKKINSFDKIIWFVGLADASKQP